MEATNIDTISVNYKFGDLAPTASTIIFNGIDTESSPKTIYCSIVNVTPDIKLQLEVEGSDDFKLSLTDSLLSSETAENVFEFSDKQPEIRFMINYFPSKRGATTAKLNCLSGDGKGESEVRQSFNLVGLDGAANGEYPGSAPVTQCARFHFQITRVQGSATLDANRVEEDSSSAVVRPSDQDSSKSTDLSSSSSSDSLELMAENVFNEEPPVTLDAIPNGTIQNDAVLNGNGQARGAARVVSRSGPSIFFPPTAVNSRNERYVTLYNEGDEEAIVSVTGLVEPNFSLNTQLFTVPPNSERFLTVTFSPSEAGLHELLLNLRCSDSIIFLDFHGSTF